MLEKKLVDILNSAYIEPREIAPVLRATVLMCKIRRRKTYVYGAGKDVDIFIRYLLDEGISVCGIIDADEKRKGSLIEGIRIISSDEFEKRACDRERIFVFVYAFISRDSLSGKKVYQLLQKAGDYMFVGEYRYDIAGFLPQHAKHFEDRRAFYKSHKEELKETLNLFADEMSKEVFIEYIRTFVECSTFSLYEIPTREKYFFDQNHKKIYTHLQEEVWVNCGADIGGTIGEYYLNGLPVKKIFAVEGNTNILDELKKNLNLFPENFRKKITIISYYIDGSEKMAEQFIDNKEKITLINADIEGNELDLLKEMRIIISQDRPVIALCAYHKNDDVITLIKYIRQIATNYHFVLRKYVGWLRGDTRRGLELVLYAVPEERLSLN